MSDDFYKDIAGFSSFSDFSDMQHYRAAPPSWCVVAADVRQSTQAIEDGRYKDVNLAGAAVITALLNACGDRHLPYVFGGDGACLLIPPAFHATALQALARVGSHVAASFGLQLRTGIVPLQDLYAAGAWLRVSRHNLSPVMSQAVFQGTALGLAEKWLKQGDVRVAAPPIDTAAPDLGGLSCRWQPIAAQRGEILSVIVQASTAQQAAPWQVYGAVVREVTMIYTGLAHVPPLTVAQLKMTLNRKELAAEARLRAKGSRVRFALWLAVIFTDTLVKWLVFFAARAPFARAGARYRSEMAHHSDMRKCDEALRFIIDSTPDERRALEVALTAHEKAGRITFGIHASTSALMTCLVFGGADSHVHFVDGADGGYAMAARQIKDKAKSA